MEAIYLDNCATTRVDPFVADEIRRVMLDVYGNPSSLHTLGIRAQALLEEARGMLADALGCQPVEVVFTSGGTEANNLAILGAAGALRRRGNTVVAAAYEHASVLEPLKQLEQQGFTVRLVKPEPDGNLDPDRFADAVDADTILVSCMLVNSEVGSIAPIADLARLVRRKSKLALVHCDGVQALGKLPFSASRLGVDLLSVSGHKIHAPKGCGALYVKKGVRILPLLHGGGQERGLRPGTESLPLIWGFGVAAKGAAASAVDNLGNMEQLHQYFREKAESFPGVRMNSPADGTPYLCNLSAPGYRSEILLHYLGARGVYVSSGSACSKGARSHVLTSMGLPADVVDGALRVSFCKDTTREELDVFFATLADALRDVHR